MTELLTGWFYNLDNGRPDSVAAVELRAMAAESPALILLCEAIGYRLPALPGYTLIRDRSREGRANIAAYVRKDLPVSRVEWHDLRKTWARTDFPGAHWPRSYLSFLAGRVQVIVLHQPPNTRNGDTLPAQVEGMRRLRRIMAPWIRFGWGLVRRPRIAVGDYNYRATDTDKPGPARLARKVGGFVYGDRIDCLVERRASVIETGYPKTVGGVRLGSDHGHAFRFTAVVQSRWTRPVKENKR